VVVVVTNGLDSALDVGTVDPDPGVFVVGDADTAPHAATRRKQDAAIR
jgi:hypothetical protein